MANQRKTCLSIYHRISDPKEDSDAEQEESFQSDYSELPIRGQGDGIYFEASGQLRNPHLDRLKPKSASTSMNESQVHCQYILVYRT